MGQWVKGQSGNPKGRPVASRQKVAERLITDLATVWEEEGENVLRRLALTEPAKLATIAYGLLPREAFLRVEHQTALDAEAQEAMHEVLQAVATVLPDARARQPGDVFALVCDALRMHTARLTIDAKPIGQIGHSARSSDNQSEGNGS